MPTIKVRSLTFQSQPFRKLKNLEIAFADRVTLIAGHNGIGKSTILGLVANTFGLTGKGDPRTYSGDPFFGSVERIVYLALAEVEPAQVDPSEAPLVAIDIDGTILSKRCSMTKRTAWKRARIVPRTVDGNEGDEPGPDAKVPLPTIYLGITRLSPVGEADEAAVQSRKLPMEDADSALMLSFVRSVIQGIDLTNDVTHLSIRGSRKKTGQPGYAGHDALAISLGQDSLAAIATAIASFNRLKRDMGEAYPGGLLVIDELDAGFHPHAIGRLAAGLKNAARDLRLQIIATTHSPSLISAIHPEGGGDARAQDSIVYILDTRHPRVAEDQSLDAILSDMALNPDQDAEKKLVLTVYFEDKECLQFFEAIYPSQKRGGLGRRIGVKINLVGLGVGGSNLVKLPSNDPVFLDRVLIVDADTRIPQAAAKRGNIVKFPCPSGASGTDRSPENVIRLFLKDLIEVDDDAHRSALFALKVTNPTTDKVRSAFFEDGSGSSGKRESTKKWWASKWKTIERWGVIKIWEGMHQAEVTRFIQQFETATTQTAARISARGLANRGRLR